MRPSINWRTLLAEHAVPFIERGANVKRGELNIRCPFCASADPSFHMGLNPETGYWACWRNSDHRGKSPLRLLVQLLQVSYYQARKIAGVGESYTDPDGFDALADRLLRGRAPEAVVEGPAALTWPDEIKPLVDRHSGRRFFHYLAWDRNFGMQGTESLAQDYGVRYCVSGPFKNRVVLPYTDDQSNLVAWTGRAIGDSEIRYRDLEHDVCRVLPKKTLYNLGPVAEGSANQKLHTLVVVEGPIDALKLDVFGHQHGVRAVALSTNSVSEDQIYLIQELAQRFQWLLVMMDTLSRLGVVASMRMKQHLSFVHPRMSITAVPYGKKDAGELSPREAARWAQSLKENL